MYVERLLTLRNIREGKPGAILWASPGSCGNLKDTWTTLKLLFGDPGVGL